MGARFAQSSLSSICDSSLDLLSCIPKITLPCLVSVFKNRLIECQVRNDFSILRGASNF